MASNTADSPRRRRKVALLVGFVLLTVGVLAAHASPPEGYELSIYEATPVAFWFGAGAAVLVAAFVALTADARRFRLGGLLLGVTATVTVAALPLIRGYRFYGRGDSLTHLGWAKDMAAGQLSPFGLLYPGTHTIAVFITDATGVPLTQSLMVMVAAFTLAYLLFVPLAIWAITTDQRAATLGALAAFLLLPINTVSVFNMAHPTSQAIMFLPLIVYLVAKYVTGTPGTPIPLVDSSFGLLLALTSVAVVLVHPQQAANVIVLFLAVAFVQTLYGWVRPDHAIGRHRRMHLQTAVLAITFLVWAPRYDRATGTISTLVHRLVTGSTGATEIGQRGLALAQIGASIDVLFLKLFLVSVVFCGLAAILMIGSLFGRLDGSAHTVALSKYLTVGLFPLFVLFGAFLVTSYSKLHFRELGFIMVLVTMLGAISLARVVALLSARVSKRAVHVAVVAAFGVALALSALTVYQSPYVYQASGHVPDEQMSGYETAFDHRGAVTFTGIRGPGERFADGILGYERSRTADFTGTPIYGFTPATGRNFTGAYLSGYFEDDRYLPITHTIRQREVEVYDGLRFGASGFDSLDAQPGIDRVHSGDGLRLYLVNGSAA